MEQADDGRYVAFRDGGIESANKLNGSSHDRVSFLGWECLNGRRVAFVSGAMDILRLRRASGAVGSALAIS
jgi:hypothetical protein